MKEIKYPVKMQSTESNLIVEFISDVEGTVANPDDHHRLGKFSAGWEVIHNEKFWTKLPEKAKSVDIKKVKLFEWIYLDGDDWIISTSLLTKKEAKAYFTGNITRYKKTGRSFKV